MIPATEAEIRRLHAATGYLADPHTAIGIAAARALPCTGGVPVVAMATAHPAKFPDAMERATGHRPALPPRMADLFATEGTVQRAAERSCRRGGGGSGAGGAEYAVGIA